MTTYAPTTELEAVNAMLATIGDSPVNSLVNTGLLNVDRAVATLHEVSRQFQAEGWHFNSESTYTINPDVNQFLTVPLNTLRVDNIGTSTNDDLTLRGTKLYNRTTHSFLAAASVTVDIVLFLPYTDLPEDARSYVQARAARIFQNRMLGSEELHKFAAGDENSAREAILEGEMFHKANRLVQAEGWHFNTERNYTLTPDVDGFITVPANTLRADSDGESAGTDVAMRGNRLYNKTDHTFVFTTPIKVELVRLLPYADLTEVTKQYIKAKAARMFHDVLRPVTSAPTSVTLADLRRRNALQSEETARVALVVEDGENQDNNMFTDSFSVSDLLNRSI